VKRVSVFIDGLQTSHSLQLLKERFRQKHRLVNTFMKNLAELPTPLSNTDSLKSFYNKMESYVHGLESVGKYPDSYGSILILITLGKLPKELRRNITRDNGGDNWDFQTCGQPYSKSLPFKMRTVHLLAVCPMNSCLQHHL
jgi:hypothetical protein